MRFSILTDSPDYIPEGVLPPGLQVWLDGKPFDGAVRVDDTEGWIDVRTAVGLKRYQGKVELIFGGSPITKATRASIEASLPHKLDVRLPKIPPLPPLPKVLPKVLPQHYDEIAQTFYDALLRINYNLETLNTTMKGLLVEEGE
jgi:hypothetical protein